MLLTIYAKIENMISVTNNVQKFERIPHLEIENWSEISANPLCFILRARCRIFILQRAPGRLIAILFDLRLLLLFQV